MIIKQNVGHSNVMFICCVALHGLPPDRGVYDSYMSALSPLSPLTVSAELRKTLMLDIILNNLKSIKKTQKKHVGVFIKVCLVFNKFVS